MSPWVIHIKHLVHHFQACNQILVFKKKIEFPESPVQTGRFGRFCPVPAGSIPGLEKNPVFSKKFADRTGQPCKLVRPAGFAGSGPVLITLLLAILNDILVWKFQNA